MSIGLNYLCVNKSIKPVKNRTVSFKNHPIEQNNVEIISKQEKTTRGAKIGIIFALTILTGICIYKGKSLKNIWNKFFANKNKTITEVSKKLKFEGSGAFNDIKDIGVKLPDGTIRFETEQGAIDYARKIVCEALQGPQQKQREVAVAVKGKDLLGIAEGNCDGVNIKNIKGILQLDTKDKLLNTPRDIILIHGHPDIYGFGRTNPLSCGGGDICMLRNYNLKSLVAYNGKGEYNMVEISDINKFAGQPLLNLKLIKAEDEYVREKVLSPAENNRYMDIEKIFEKCKKNGAQKPSQLLAEYRQLDEKFRKMEVVYQTNEDYARTLHQMYKNEAESNGLKYSTNFSNL